ncbi:hypothetical protein ABE527_20120 [Brucella sp. TWI432]
MCREIRAYSQREQQPAENANRRDAGEDADEDHGGVLREIKV